MKSIAIIIPDINSKAPIKIALQLAVMSSKHYNVTIFTLKGDDKKTHGIICKRLSLFNLFSLKKFDYIHTHCCVPDMYGAILKIFFKKSKWISTLHCNPFIEFKDSKNKMGMYVFVHLWLNILRLSDAVVVLNKSLEKRLKNIKTTVIYNGIDIDKQRIDVSILNDINKFSNGRKVIGGYGVLREIKGFHQVLSVAKDINDLCFIIIGDGPDYDKYKKFILDNELKKNVLLLGYQENVHKFLPIFDLFLMPSYSEGFPIAFIESCCYGKKALCSNIDIFQELSCNIDMNLFELDNLSSLKNEIYASLNRDIDEESIVNYYNNNLKSESMYSNYKELYELLNV